MGESTPERALQLDGNVAAGLLTELFCCEPSEAMTVCAGCGATGPIGRLLAYGLEMGAILRCPNCGQAVLRVGVAGAARWVDLRGAVSVRFAVTS